MPTFGALYPSAWRGVPPGLLSVDAPVWHRFLDKYARAFPGFYYNVRVGAAPDLGPTCPPDLKAISESIGRKRLDAVSVRAADVWLFEITTAASERLLGQLLTYLTLFVEETNDPRPLVPALVAAEIDGDLARVMNFHGIGVYLV